MRWLPWLLLIPWAAVAAQTWMPAGEGEASHCAQCHQREHREFARSRMAVAAETPDFVREWERNGRAEHCLACHAPGGGQGVGCRDCHGDGGHPYPKLATPQVCARCHDAPGESTVRSLLPSPAANDGQRCLSCHVSAAGGGHDFQGPTRPGFLADVARLRLSLRRDAEGDRLLVHVRHRAGHALPGGTTGRAVWLLVDFLAREGRPLASFSTRFGWYHDAAQEWRDWTLPPGPGKVIEIAMDGGDETALIEARLIYRFRPGALHEPDPREVVLDRAQFRLPQSAGAGR